MKQIIDRTPAMRAYFKQITNDNHNDNLNSRDRLVVENYRLAVYVASQYKGCGLEMEDLIGYANIGLVEAANRYDPSKGTPFASFAIPWINGEVKAGLTETGHPIRMSHESRMEVASIKRSQNAFFLKNGREATAAELGEMMEMEEREIVALLAFSESLLSTDESTDENSDGTLGDMIGGDAGENPEDKLDMEMRINCAMARLTAREREVMRRHYLQGQDLFEIGRHMKLSQSTVKNLHQSALRKVK